MIFSSCQTSLDLSQSENENPCEELRYLELKKKNVPDMTKTELEYFKKKDKECREHVKQEKNLATKNLIYILSGLGVLLAIGIYLGIALRNWH